MSQCCSFYKLKSIISEYIFVVQGTKFLRIQFIWNIFGLILILNTIFLDLICRIEMVDFIILTMVFDWALLLFD